MYSDLFSKRFGLRPTPTGLIYEDVPERARVGLCNILLFSFSGKSRHSGPYRGLYNHVCTNLRIVRDRQVEHEFRAAEIIDSVIMNCKWWEFYDICEVIINYEHIPSMREELTKQINTLFEEEYLGFELIDDKVEKRGSGFIDAKIKEARYLLKEPEFKGADEHFEKAIKAINKRPKPDAENCVKDAVAAIESVGRVIVNDENAVLSEIIKDMARRKVIPKPLDEAIQKVYAYRGNEPGVAHGATKGSKVTIYEAEFVLAMSAAIIIYLVGKQRSE